MIEILKEKKIASFEKDNRDFFIIYTKESNLKDSISLSLPANKKFYSFKKFPPFFESYIPEGYLFEIFKNLIMKEYGEVNDYLIFFLLASNIESRITFKTDKDKINYPNYNLEDILNNDNDDTFSNLLYTFLEKNSISGVQPKTIALIKDKDSLQTKEYIIKTWGDEFPNLAENEYFCMKAMQKAGVKTANVQLSKNKKFLLVEKFTFDKLKNEFLGFEEVLSLMDRSREQKYKGSYEQIAKIIYGYSTNKKESMKQFYITIVMNFLLKNGDAHLKNFGLLYDKDIQEIKFSPVYDVVNTVVYIFKDKPALTLNGQKIWHSKDILIEFGIKQCFIKKEEALKIWENCIEVIRELIEELREYIALNPNFQIIGNRMIDTLNLSLSQKPLKEIPNEIVQSWKRYKKT